MLQTRWTCPGAQVRPVTAPVAAAAALAVMTVSQKTVARSLSVLRRGNIRTHS